MTATHWKPRVNTARLCQDLAERGWSGAELARRAGISDETAYRALRGVRATARTMRRVALALGRPLRRYFLATGARRAA